MDAQAAVQRRWIDRALHAFLRYFQKMHRTFRYQVENLYILLENQGKGFRHAQV